MIISGSPWILDRVCLSLLPKQTPIAINISPSERPFLKNPYP